MGDLFSCSCEKTCARCPAVVIQPRRYMYGNRDDKHSREGTNATFANRSNEVRLGHLQRCEQYLCGTMGFSDFDVHSKRGFSDSGMIFEKDHNLYYIRVFVQ